MIELEKKMLLSKHEYACLFECSGHLKSIIKQVNYYYDTDDLAMNHQNITCRIRLTNGKYQGTMKKHTVNSDRSEEIDVEVRNGVFDNEFIDMGLKLKGELVTERCIIFKDSSCEVALDKNDYLGYTDYELEIEYLPNFEKNVPSAIQSVVHVLPCGKLSISPGDVISRCKNTKSKCQRFFERMVQNDINT